MAENKKQDQKQPEPAKTEVKKQPEYRLILPSRVKMFKEKGWKETGKTSKSGELVEVTR